MRRTWRANGGWVRCARERAWRRAFAGCSRAARFSTIARLRMAELPLCARSDLPSQLFCLVAEGWQDLGRGQAVNAEFRAQQAIKLAESGQVFIRSWAVLLERTAFLRAASRMRFVTRRRRSTCRRSAACPPRRGPSRCICPPRATIPSLPPGARCTGRPAQSAFFGRSHATRCRCWEAGAILCASSCRATRSRPTRTPVPRFFPAIRCSRLRPGAARSEPGQVVINLLGGFHVERNGHVLTGICGRRRRRVCWRRA